MSATLTMTRTSFDSLVPDEIEDFELHLDSLSNEMPEFEWNCWSCGDTYSVDRIELAIDPSTPWICQCCES